MRAITLQDIASVLGVSAKTVSRVVNGDARVSPETRERIERAVAEAGYRPNLAARSLASARSRLIGTFAPRGFSHYFAELIRGSISACRSRGYSLIVEDFDMGAPTAVDIYRSGMRNLRCDGLILPSPICDDIALLDALDADGVAYVRLSPALEPGRSAAIVADHAAGAAAVARHFLALGRHRFAVITGLPQQASAAIRRDAFVGALTAGGVDRADIEEVALNGFPTDNREGGLLGIGRLAGRQLLQSATIPDAVFAYNDELAAGVVSMARDLGLAIPGDVAVAGFDDNDAARLCWPPLTTVRQPIQAIAEQALQMLADEVSAPQGTVMVPVELIVRASTSVANDAVC